MSSLGRTPARRPRRPEAKARRHPPAAPADKRHTLTNKESPVSDYVRYVETALSDDWPVLYRGHASYKWKIEPYIARSKITWTEQDETLLDVELWMLEEFKRQSLSHLEFVPRSDLEWLAVAQHFKMPTRLLDWSFSALTALWFVVKEPKAKTDRTDGAVLIYTPKLARFSNVAPGLDSQRLEAIEKPFIYMPAHVSKRIAAQFGCFTVSTPAAGDKRSFTPFADAFVTPEEPLREVTIPRDMFPMIRNSLTQLGVNQFSVFPDLEGLASHTTWVTTRYSDEGYKS
jgi:hypothetical protein